LTLLGRDVFADEYVYCHRRKVVLQLVFNSISAAAARLGFAADVPNHDARNMSIAGKRDHYQLASVV